MATGDAVHPHSGTFASHEEQGRATIVTARRDLEDTGQGQKPDAGQMLQETTETSQDDRLREADEGWGRESLGAGARPRDARRLTPGAVRPAPTRVARCQLNVRSEGRPHARGLYHESLRQAGGKEKSAGQRWRLAAGPRAVCRGHHRTGTGGQEPTVPLRGSSAPSAFGTFGTYSRSIGFGAAEIGGIWLPGRPPTHRAAPRGPTTGDPPASTAARGWR